MHPDQFFVINSADARVYERSVKELEYHIQVLDSLRLNASAKVQIHVGGVYGDKGRSMRRFLSRYQQLDETIRRRLVIENDDRLYNLRDCLQISAESGIPVSFDVFHHSLNNSGETIRESFELSTPTWKKNDGVPMVDYSTQLKGGRTRKHTDTIDLMHFKSLLEESRPFDFDVMLEIKDKETSALKAMEILRKDSRFSTLQQVSEHKGSSLR
jgi:UV DNA damage endonuclease